MRHLKLCVWHGAVWMALALAAATMAVQLCLRYNATAGTDLTTGHIVGIGVSVLLGPMVGPIGHAQAGETIRAAVWTGSLLALVLGSLSPFMLLRRPVTTCVTTLCWMGFFFAAGLWFASALVSLGFFLS
jgi:hypothetical protein